MCIDLFVKYSFMNLWGPLEKSCCYHTLASGSLKYNKGFAFLVSWIDYLFRIDSSEFLALNFSVTSSSHVFSNTTTVGDRLYEKIEIKLIYWLNVFLLNRSCVWRGRKKDLLQLYKRCCHSSLQWNKYVITCAVRILENFNKRSYYHFYSFTAEASWRAGSVWSTFSRILLDFAFFLQQFFHLPPFSTTERYFLYFPKCQSPERALHPSVGVMCGEMKAEQ